MILLKDEDELISILGASLVPAIAVDIASSQSVAQVIDQLKAVLPFPRWCGSGWDSIDDAFEDLRESWTFPVVLVVHGWEEMFEVAAHDALAVTLGLSRLREAFSRVGQQFEVLYLGDWDKT